jgi:transposase-like protein
MNPVIFKNFYRRFPSEEACVGYIEELRWPDGRLCPHCGSTKTYKFKDGKLFKCGDCKKQFTVKAGTIFTDSHVKLQDWLLTVTLLTSPDDATIRSTRLAAYIGITQKSAWFVLRRIRYALEYGPEPVSSEGRKRTEPYRVDISFELAMGKIISVPMSNAGP